MSAQTPIVEMFGAAVTKVEAKLLTYLQQENPTTVQLHYLYGHPLEIVKTLTEMENPQAYQYKKYPLVALFMDFQESKPRTGRELLTVRLQVIIANQADPEIKAADRYTANFKRILYPIYEELCRQLVASPYFQGANTPVHTKIDRPFWGKEGLYGNIAHIGTDILDCVELKNLDLVIRRCACVSAPTSNF